MVVQSEATLSQSIYRDACPDAVPGIVVRMVPNSGGEWVKVNNELHADWIEIRQHPVGDQIDPLPRSLMDFVSGYRCRLGTRLLSCC